jgi:hypothetical protein
MAYLVGPGVPLRTCSVAAAAAAAVVVEVPPDFESPAFGVFFLHFEDLPYS